MHRFCNAQSVNTLFVLLFLLSCSLFAQNTDRAYVSQNTTSVPFEPNQAQLNELVEALNCTLTGSDHHFDRLNGYFFDAELTHQYLQKLENSQYPQINQKAAPMFMNWSNQTKQLLQSFQGKLAEIKLIETTQRYGTTPDMKIVVASLHLYFKDGAKEPLRLMLIDFNGYYRILNQEE